MAGIFFINQIHKTKTKTKMDEAKEFSHVENAEGAKVEIRPIKESEKAIYVEAKLKIWLPKSVCKRHENGNYAIPFWIISKAIK